MDSGTLGLAIGVIGVLISAVTLVFVVREWRARREISWEVNSRLSPWVSGQPPRRRRVVEAVWTAPTFVRPIVLHGASLVSQVSRDVAESTERSVENAGLMPGWLPANQSHRVLVESDDWQRAWVQVVFGIPNSRSVSVAWAPLASAGERAFAVPPAQRGPIVRMLASWRSSGAPVGPGGVSRRVVGPGPRQEERVQAALATGATWPLPPPPPKRRTRRHRSGKAG